MIIKDKIYIRSDYLGAHITGLCQLFTYPNPEFHQKKNMKITTAGIAPTLYHYDMVSNDTSRVLILPRGGYDKIAKFHEDLGIPFRILDERAVSDKLLDVELSSKIILDSNQNNLVDILINNEGGLIESPCGCITGDAIINFNRCKKGFKTTIEKAYKSFNNINRKNHNWDLNHKTYVRSYNGESVQLHSVNDIVYSGEKEVWKMTLHNGRSIKATSDHKIMTREGWVKLTELKIAISEVMCDTLRAVARNDVKAHYNDIEVYGLSYHPYSRLKIDKRGEGSYTNRIAHHRLIYEAFANNLDMLEYINILRTDILKASKLNYLNPKEYVVHHKDFDHYNNDPSNLEPLSHSRHKTLHSEKNKFNFNQGIPFYDLVKSIEYIGKEKTYDIICEDPHRNFVSNGMIIHNSGKTIAILGLISRIKKPTLILMHEHRLATQWMEELSKNIIGDYSLSLIGGGKKELGDITVGIINTAFGMIQENSSCFDGFENVVIDECLDPETLITVPDGIKRLGDIKIGDTVLTPKGTAKVKNKWSTTKKAYKYATTKGNSIIASENHIMHTLKIPDAGFSCGVKNEKIGDCTHLLVSRKINKNKVLPKFNLLNYLFGWYLGDGTCDKGRIKFGFTKKASYFEEIFEDLDSSLFSKFINKRGDHVYTLDKDVNNELISKFNIKDGSKDKNLKIPDDIFKSADISFLRGIFDADGCRHVNSGKGNHNFIELDLILKNCIYQINAMLKSYSIYSTILQIDRKPVKHSTIYRLNIHGKDCIELFNDVIGFWVTYKHSTVTSSYHGKSPYRMFKIKDKEYVGTRELIDIELDDEDKLFYANGFITHNCHRIPSAMFLNVVNNIPAKYRTGVTGTVKRTDGKHLLLYDVIGKMLISVKENELKHRITDFDYEMIQTDTAFELPTRKIWTGKKKDHQIDNAKCLAMLTEDEGRNNLIITKIIEDIKLGHLPLVLSDRVKHNTLIAERLNELGFKTVLLIGATRKKVDWGKVKTDLSIKCIVATSKIATEGLDNPRMSSLHLTCPTENLPQLKQKLGRIRRTFDGKLLPVVRDYVDNLAFYNRDDKKVYTYKRKGSKRGKFYLQLKSDYTN